MIAELNSGRYFKRDLAPLRVVTVGATKEMITTMGGLSIQPDISLDECTLESKDLLVLPGGTTSELYENSLIIFAIKTFQLKITQYNNLDSIIN